MGMGIGKLKGIPIMKKLILLSMLIPFLYLSCTVNFVTGTPLAKKQEELYRKYKTGEKVDKKEIRNLKTNWWVLSASKVSPNNLIIRQWALIDLLIGVPLHHQEILTAMKQLSYYGDQKPKEELCLIWGEGYSYYLYTKQILTEWLRTFHIKNYEVQILNDNIDSIIFIVSGIEFGFAITSYQDRGLYYPAPFGDLRKQPLEDYLQKLVPSLQNFPQINCKGVERKLISHSLVEYKIDVKLVGLNVHIPKESSKIIVQDGIPINFNFYEGYENKYPNKEAEWKDILNPMRIISSWFIW